MFFITMLILGEKTKIELFEKNFWKWHLFFLIFRFTEIYGYFFVEKKLVIDDSERERCPWETTFYQNKLLNKNVNIIQYPPISAVRTWWKKTMNGEMGADFFVLFFRILSKKYKDPKNLVFGQHFLPVFAIRVPNLFTPFFEISDTLY